MRVGFVRDSLFTSVLCVVITVWVDLATIAGPNQPGNTEWTNTYIHTSGRVPTGPCCEVLQQALPGRRHRHQPNRPGPNEHTHACTHVYKNVDTIWCARVHVQGHLGGFADRALLRGPPAGAAWPPPQAQPNRPGPNEHTHACTHVYINLDGIKCARVDARTSGRVPTGPCCFPSRPCLAAVAVASSVYAACRATWGGEGVGRGIACVCVGGCAATLGQVHSAVPSRSGQGPTAPSAACTGVVGAGPRGGGKCGP